ncbi:MAG: short-chain dehydrogenase/reductase [Frankiales bacterium]|nr:short-chain dehydrogenase/reductase [Frankiales bacterium]
MPAERPLGVVIVTGSQSGLGASVVAAVRKAGGAPVGFDRTDGADIVVDIADTRAVDEAVQRVIAECGGVDGVVTCAGTDACGPLDGVSAEDWERVVRVNLFGTAAVVRSALPSLKARGGRIVTVASTLGHRVFGDASAYCASKFGVVGFTRALAAEVKGEVGVTLLTPGGMTTHFFDDRDERYKPGPDARLGDPDDVAATVVFALAQPTGCEIKELVVTSSWEGSWP